MVFDGKTFTTFDTDLLSDLKAAQAAPIAGPAPGASRGPASGAGPGRHGRNGSRDRRVGAVVMVGFVALFALLAGVAIAARSTDGPKRHEADRKSAKPLPTPAQAAALVASAITHTEQANSFDVNYRLSQTGPGGTPTTTTPTRCYTPPSGSPWAAAAKKLSQLPGARPSGGLNEICATVIGPTSPVSGHGSVTVDPKAMTVTADTGGLKVTLDLTGDMIIEDGGAGIGSPGGLKLSQFASTVEGTIGQRAGAVGMLQLASPNGYLAIEGEAVTGATASGTGTVDGVDVTNFDVSVDLNRLALVPGLTADETKTIADALGVLHGEGYTQTSLRVAIDAAGFIRQVHAVDHFADGGTATYDGTFSNFGCTAAAAPGSTATTAAPCPGAPGATPPESSTTTTPPTTTPPPATTPLSPPGSTTPTTGAGSTTTTVPGSTTTSGP